MCFSQLFLERNAVMKGKNGPRVPNGQWTGVRQSSDRERQKQTDMTWGVGACAGLAGVAKIRGRRIERKEGVPFGRMGIYLTRKRG